MGIISSNSMMNAMADNIYPKMDSMVTRMALITVVTTSHTTQMTVVIQVQATQTTLETHVQAIQTILETQVHASQAQEQGHQSQQSA